MNTENQYKEEQEVWVKARICNDELDRYGDLKLNITYSHGSCLAHCLPSEIRTTEQIVQEHGALAPQNDQYKNWEWDEESEVWRPKTANEGDKTPHNAELPAQNAEPSEGDECWVKAEFVTTVSDDSRAVKFRDCEDNAHIIFMDEEDVRFTDPTHSTAVITFIEPDRTRKFKKGDKVQRRKELDGRDLRKTCPSLPFDEIFTIAEDEKNPWEIKVKWGDKTAQGGFIYFELVEPAPEEKFFIEDETSYDSYRINFGTPNNHMFVAKLDTDFYTLEEARQECERLSKKDRDNEF